VSGIRDVTEKDIRYASELGYTIKLLAVIKSGKEVEARVHPTLIPRESPLAAVNGVFNAIMVNGDMTGRSIYYGRGAGQMPTAQTVLADVCEVVRNIMSKSPLRMKPIPGAHNGLKIKPIDQIETRYYLRLSLMDKPGVMARVTSIFGSHSISLASVLQKELKASKFVTVLVVTHPAREKNLQAALDEINALDVVGAKSVMFRIEDI
jgi:homoserine dehydrogenase